MTICFDEKTMNSFCPVGLISFRLVSRRVVLLIWFENKVGLGIICITVVLNINFPADIVNGFGENGKEQRPQNRSLWNALIDTIVI